MLSEKVMTCIDCGRGWVLTQSAVDHCNSKGWPLPRRCKPCRDVNRAKKAAEAREAQRIASSVEQH